MSLQNKYPSLLMDIRKLYWRCSIMNKKIAGVLVLLFVLGTMGVYAQSYTCTMVDSGSGWEVWRDDATGQTWVEWRGVQWIVNVIGKTARGAYEVACSNGARGAVNGYAALATLYSGGTSAPPAAAFIAMYNAVCYLGDQAFR
jgi:hypothetical protein